MSIFRKIFGLEENQNSYKYKLKKAMSLHGESVKYVTERRGNNDDVIGRGGALAVHNDTFIVDSSGDRIFACQIKNLEIAWLMSGNGVVVKGPNILDEGRERTITVHFVYHRK